MNTHTLTKTLTNMMAHAQLSLFPIKLTKTREQNMAQRHSRSYCLTFNNPLHIAINLKCVITEF